MRPSSRKILENAVCVLVLGLTAALSFLPALMSGDLPLDVKSIFFAPPWEEARPPGLEPVTDSAAAQFALRIYPSCLFLQQTFQSHDSLLWDPMEGMGAPFFALWRSRCLSPFSLPFYVLPLGLAFIVSALLKLAVAGWCAFYAARRLAFPPAMALLVALAFQLSGPVYLWSGLPLSDVTPWLPVLLLCSERLILGQFRAWALTAVVIAVMALGGDPETLAGALLFSLVYLLARRLRDPGHAQLARAISGWAIAIAAGLALVAVQLAPYLEYLLQAAAPATPPAMLLAGRDLLLLLSPALLDPARGDAAAAARLLHAGVLQVFLLALWLALRRLLTRPLRRRMEALFLTALVLVLSAFVATPLLNRLPFLDQLGPQHLLIALPLAFTFIAAASVEEWNELNPEQCKAALARLVVLVPVLWGGAFIVVLAYGGISDGVKVWPALLWMGVAAVVILVMLGATLFRPNVRVSGYVLCAVTAGLQWAAFGPRIDYTARAEAFPETSMITSLRAMETRIGGSEALKQWPLAGNGIPQVFAPGGASLARYNAFMAQADQDPLLLRRTGARALVLTKEDIQGAFAAVRPVLNIQEVYPSGAILFRDLDTIPRARMIYEAQSVDQFDPALLHSEQLPLVEGAALPEKSDGPYAKATIAEGETHTKVLVNIAHTRRGLLVLADTFYPGWRATVDGKLTEIRPVDGVFRGVEVGEGEHEVVFVYDPFSLKLGAGISLIAALVVLVNLRHFLPRRRNAWSV